MKKIVKLILLIINYFLLAALLASTLAGFVKPSSFIWFSMLGYAYLYLAIANALFVILWLCMGSKWFILSLAGLVVRYTFLPLYFQVGGTEEAKLDDAAKAETVKVLTYNVHHFQGIELNASLADTNMLQFLDIIDEEHPDVVLMQEYVGKGSKVHVTDSLKARGYCHNVSGQESLGLTGEVIFSKLPVLGTLRFEEPANFYADLLWLGDTLRVYCIHLESYKLDASDKKQINDLRRGTLDSTTGRSTYHKFKNTILAHEDELQLIEALISRRDNRTIVAGDFNDPPASFFYQKIRKHLKDSYCEVGQGFSTTYHGTFTKSRNTIFPAFRIDYLLHTPDLKAVSYKRIKTDISDHYPVVVEIR